MVVQRLPRRVGLAHPLPFSKSGLRAARALCKYRPAAEGVAQYRSADPLLGMGAGGCCPHLSLLPMTYARITLTLVS